MVLVIIVLGFLGLCFGSFTNALVWRVYLREKGQKSRELSILNGRSMCPDCRHELAAKDLMPVFSWLALHGRCRYCGKPISWQYPAVELTGAAVFVISYLLWPVTLAGAGQWILFVSWLAAAIGLLALAVYDIRWMVLPNHILYPALLAALGGRLAYIFFYTDNIAHNLELLALSLIVASGVFLLLFIVSQGKWIGFGDVRLGLVTGTLLATPSKSFLMIFLSSILGTAFVLPALLAGKKTATSRMPYGPFLIASTFIVLLFGDSIINWYKIHLL